MIGTLIGHYKILEKLGEGGMGVVYKATDTKLDRLVALKFLPDELTKSASDTARFVQEAKAAAALNHPSICTIHGIEESDGKQFIVLEFVDGQTLGEKGRSINQKQAIDIAIQIADGLAAAHEKGIVHRDIKPDNIMIRKDGIALVMDFGLAKLRGVTNLTQQGSTVGTARYMSPEQVQGEEIDHRSDIFSLGVLMYELFSGQLPFKGVHETALMYEIVHVDPEPMGTLKSDIPPELDAIVLECLAKEKADRFQSAAEVSKELRRFKRESSRQMASRVTRRKSIPAIPAMSAQSSARYPWMRSSILPWMLAGLLFVIAGVSLWRPWSSAPAAPDVTRFSIKYSSDASVDTRVHPGIDISPDGSRIVYRAGTDLYVRELSSLEPVRIDGIQDGMHPAFSPDGQSIAYFESEQALWKTQVDGSKPTLLSTLDRVSGSRRGLAWTQRGTILFSAAIGGLMEIDANGGAVRELTHLDTTARERTHRWPDVLPNGKGVIFTMGLLESPDYYEDASIYAYDFESGERKLLLQGASTAKYSPTGHLLFTRLGILYGIRFDQDRLETIGEPVQLINGVAGDPTSGAMQYALSANGTLVYVPGDASQLGQQLVKLDSQGNVSPFPAPERHYFYPRISPDGKRIVVTVGSTREMDVYIYEIARNLLQRFTYGGLNSTPVWSPDGRFIAYSRRTRSDTVDIMIKRADGTGIERLVFSRTGDYTDITDWSSDGRTLLLDFGESHDDPGGLYLLDIDNPTGVRPFARSEFRVTRGSFSPDMRYIAYASDRNGLSNVFVQSTTEQGGFWQVSTASGQAPRWSSDGTALYFNDSRSRVIMQASIVPGASFRFNEAQPVAESFRTPAIDPAFFPFDVFPDGSGFLTVISASVNTRQDVVVVTNWFEELERAFRNDK